MAAAGGAEIESIDNAMPGRQSSLLVPVVMWLAMLSLAACATGKRQRADEWRSFGGEPSFLGNHELPPPDDGSVEPGSLRVILHSPTLEANEAALESLAGALLLQFRNAGFGKLELLPRGSNRRAHYEIALYESGKDGTFDFDEEAGIWADAGTQAAARILTERMGKKSVRRATHGTVLDFFFFFGNEGTYDFAGIFRQRTSMQASHTASGAANSGSDTTGSGKLSLLSGIQWNPKTHAFESPFICQIAVSGDSFLPEGAREVAMRNVFLRRFPAFATGGASPADSSGADIPFSPWPRDPGSGHQRRKRMESLSLQVRTSLRHARSSRNMLALLAEIDEQLGAEAPASLPSEVTDLVTSRALLVRQLLLQQDPQTPPGAESARVHRTMRLSAPAKVKAGKQFTAQITLDAIPALATPDTTTPVEVRFCLIAPGCSFPDGDNAQVLQLPASGPAQAVFFALVLEDANTATLRLRCEVWNGSTLARTLDCEVGVKRFGAIPESEKSLVSLDPTADASNDEPALTMTVTTIGDRTHFSVHGTDLVPQSETVETVRIRSWLRDRMAEIGPHLRGEDPDAGVSSSARANLDGLGTELWKRAAPEAFRTQFANLRARFGARFRSIRIYTDDPGVPWELMRPDGDDGRSADFLGVSHRIGRWHRFGDNRARQSPMRRITLRDLAVLAPVYSGESMLPEQRREVDFLATQPGYRAVPATFQGLRTVLADLPCGIVHFAGHGKATRVGSTESYAMVMQDQEVTPFTWRGVATDASANGTLFFFNACDMGRGESVGSFVDGFAATIADLGSCGCIAATCRVADAGAVTFAIEFYRRLYAAGPGEKVLLADAVRGARSECLRKGFATGLAFVFYGDPDLEVVR